MSNDSTIIDIDELHRPEDKQDPRIERPDDHLEELEEREQKAGFVTPFLITLDGYFLVDGNSRVEVLERLAEQTGDDDYRKLRLIGQKGNYGYAVPIKEVDLDPETASMEVNLFRQNTSQADRARFLDYLVQTRIVDEHDGVARDATAELLDHYDHHSTRGDEWDEPADVKDELTRLLETVGFESPSNARKYVDYYHRAPETVRRAWALKELSFSHVQQLTAIAELIDDGASLTNVDLPDRNTDFDDLVQNSKEAHRYDDSKTYYTRDDLREVVRKLEAQSQDEEPPTSENTREETPDQDVVDETQDTRTQHSEDEEQQEDDEGDSTISADDLRERFSSKQLNQVEEIADVWDISPDDILSTLANSDAPKSKLMKMVSTMREAQERTSSEDAPHLDEELHKAKPIETQHVTCYFHDCREMGAEVEEGDIDLFVFSPPYFTQGHTIDPAHWLEDRDSVDSRAELDRAYAGFLDEMYDVFDVLAKHLTDGGRLIFVVSDVQAKYDEHSRRPRYDVPADLSHVIRQQLNPELRDSGRATLQYQNTIIWSKGFGTGVERFKKSGKPTEFRPNDTTERILVFRKGGNRADTGFSVSPEEFEPYWDSLWRIHPETSSEHPAPYPIELVKPLIELYSVPGDTVADPMCGSGTTLRAVQELNQEYAKPRTAYGWEAFVSENFDQAGYWSTVFHRIKLPELREDGPAGLDAWINPASVI